MSDLRIGSLCSGYGGLELGVQAVYGGTTAWVSEIDKGACKILDHRFPGVPNIGDMTTVDWSAVEPVDLICGGTPCQDLSHAGKRAGMTEGSRSNLWVAMREAIAVIRPSTVIWENVRGAYSAAADSDVEIGPGLLGPRDGGPALRALGRVLGDLSDLGYDATWHGLHASDVGAPHERLRVFVAAHARDHSSGDHLRSVADQQEGQRRPGAPVDSGSGGGTGLPAYRTGDPNLNEWREVARPVERWAAITGRRAPSVHDRIELIAEWMMGLPAGWVTDVPGITRNEALRAIGNGVCPQQCAEALRVMASWEAAA